MKPNIRGYPRSQVHLGFQGWRLSNNQGRGYLVSYNFPLQMNWLIRLEKNVNAKLVQSRDGYVYLLRQVDNSDGARRFSPVRVRKLFSSSLVLLIGVSFWMGLSTISTSKLEPATKSASSSDTPSNLGDETCSFDQSVSLASLQSLLGGRSTTLELLEKTEVLVLGGYRGLRMKIACGSEEYLVEASLIKVNSEWKLKKVARLDN